MKSTIKVYQLTHQSGVPIEGNILKSIATALDGVLTPNKAENIIKEELQKTGNENKQYVILTVYTK